jgi:hypothetical protein
MLFDNGDDVLESEKERNLYYKFFAGYFFNEFIPGYEERLASFQQLLREEMQQHSWKPAREITLSTASTHVSFDNHGYLIGFQGDRGEFADIVIHDRENHFLIVIEAKFMTDWDFAKDVKVNAHRLEYIASQMHDTDIIPCLLVPKQKWDAAVELATRIENNVWKLQNAPNSRLIILKWEHFAELSENVAVKTYLNYQLSLSKQTARYTINDGKIMRRA